MKYQDFLYLHGLNSFPGFGPKKLHIISQKFSSFKEAFNAGTHEWGAIPLEQEVTRAWLRFREKFDLEKSLAVLAKNNIKLTYYKDSDYPKLLLEIKLYPLLLYYKGALNKPDEQCVAVVGTRKITPYGKSVTAQLVTPLVQCGITIVSGLAYGVDALAHETALEQEGRTIAVLACGLDDETLYPKEHSKLAHRIVNAGGLLISEYPPGREALKFNFVARNRIISGLSTGVLITECGEKSGALITADYAVEQNRNVYAVPGSIHQPYSHGPHSLLKAGAKVVTRAEDILEDFALASPKKILTSPGLLTHEEKIILSGLTTQPRFIDSIMSETKLTMQVISTTLTLLEIKGLVKNIGLQHYVKVE